MDSSVAFFFFNVSRNVWIGFWNQTRGLYNFIKNQRRLEYFCLKFSSTVLVEPIWWYSNVPCLCIQQWKVVELDFLYPSEGIHRRWESGYRITSMAATTEQAAFILSIPKRKLLDETQETLRTSAFPSTHVKVIEHNSNICFPFCWFIYWRRMSTE